MRMAHVMRQCSRRLEAQLRNTSRSARPRRCTNFGRTSTQHGLLADQRDRARPLAARERGRGLAAQPNP